MAEVFDQAEDDGIERFDKLPSWIEEILYKIIATNGLNATARLVKEMDLEDCEPIT